MKNYAKILALFIAILILLIGNSWAEEESQPQPGERGGGYKKVTIACFGPNGEPLSPCDVEFKPNISVAVPCMPSSCRCITKPSGMCQLFLRCCGHGPSAPSIMWNVKATSIYGEKKTYFWTNCGWTCDESKYIKFEFK